MLAVSWACFKVIERVSNLMVAESKKKPGWVELKNLFCLIYVVVNFLSQVIFVFLLFLGMVIYANEVETKEK